MKEKFNWEKIIQELGLAEYVRGIDERNINDKHKYLAQANAYNGWCGVCTYSNLKDLAKDIIEDLQRGEESSTWQIYDKSGNKLKYKFDLNIKILK